MTDVSTSSEAKIMADIQTTNSMGRTSTYVMMLGLVSLTLLTVFPSAMSGTFVFPWGSWIAAVLFAIGVAGVIANGIDLVNFKRNNKAEYSKVIN